MFSPGRPSLAWSQRLPDVDLGGLREAVERQRKSSYAVLQTVLADPRCSRFLLSLGHLVERRGWRNEIDSEALAVLSQPDSHAGRQDSGAVASQGGEARRAFPAAQHRCATRSSNRPREAAYAAEFFLPLYAAHAPAKRYVKRLAKVQASLRTRARHRKQPHPARGDQAGRPARTSSRRRRGRRLASPRSDCGGECAAQEMAAIQVDASILGPLTSSFARRKLRWGLLPQGLPLTISVTDIQLPYGQTGPQVPLTPAVFHIMLALIGRERHGYDIMQQVKSDSRGPSKWGRERCTARWTA